MTLAEAKQASAAYQEKLYDEIEILAFIVSKVSNVPLKDIFDRKYLADYDRIMQETADFDYKKVMKDRKEWEELHGND